MPRELFQLALDAVADGRGRHVIVLLTCLRAANDVSSPAAWCDASEARAAVAGVDALRSESKHAWLDFYHSAADDFPLREWGLRLDLDLPALVLLSPEDPGKRFVRPRAVSSVAAEAAATPEHRWSLAIGDFVESYAEGELEPYTLLKPPAPAAPPPPAWSRRPRRTSIEHLSRDVRVVGGGCALVFVRETRQASTPEQQAQQAQQALHQAQWYEAAASLPAWRLHRNGSRAGRTEFPQLLDMEWSPTPHGVSPARDRAEVQLRTALGAELRRDGVSLPAYVRAVFAGGVHGASSRFIFSAAAAASLPTAADVTSWVESAASDGCRPPTAAPPEAAEGGAAADADGARAADAGWLQAFVSDALPSLKAEMRSRLDERRQLRLQAEASRLAVEFDAARTAHLARARAGGGRTWGAAAAEAMAHNDRAIAALLHNASLPPLPAEAVSAGGSEPDSLEAGLDRAWMVRTARMRLEAARAFDAASARVESRPDAGSAPAGFPSYGGLRAWGPARGAALRRLRGSADASPSDDADQPDGESPADAQSRAEAEGGADAPPSAPEALLSAGSTVLRPRNRANTGPGYTAAGAAAATARVWDAPMTWDELVAKTHWL